MPQTEPLSERELAAGMGQACYDNDEAWLRNLIARSPWQQGIPKTIIDEWVSMILGRTTTKADQREQGEPQNAA